MAEFDTQINVGMNVDGVVSGTEKAKRSVRDLGESARGAGKSLGGIGDGAGQSAQKVESATKSMIQSIQRTTAATEAGDKSTRAYQESLARLRGIDVAALKPYLDQLDQAKNKAEAAARSADSLSKSLNNIKVASAIVAAAGAAFVAYAKNINNGVDALNDLKDATGSSIENISALEDIALRTGTSFDTVGTSLVKLNQALNTAKPGSDAEKAIKAIGLSVADLKALDPAEAFQKIAVSLSGYSDDANKARLTQELFGKSLKEVAPLLKDAAEAGKLVGTVTTAQAEAAEKLNKQIFGLQKNATDLSRAFVSTLVPAISEGADRFMIAYKNAGSLLGVLALYTRLDYSKGIQGNLGQIESQIKSLEERATRITSDSVMKGNDKQIADLKAQAQYLKEIRQQKILIAQGDNSDAVSRKYLDKKTSVGDIGGGPDKAALAAANAELKKQADLLNTLTGVNADYQESLTRLQAIKASGRISDEKYVELVKQLIEKQPMVVEQRKQEEEALKAAAKAQDAYVKEQLKSIEAAEKSAKSAGDTLQKYLDEEHALTLAAAKNISLAQAIAEVELARLREAQTAAIASKANDGVLLALDEEIKKREQIVQAIGRKENREAVDKSAKDAAAEWKKAAEQIEQSITDALFRGFESGKGFGENLRDTIVNTFKTMVLRPQVQAVVQGGLNAVGLGSSSSGGGGLLSSLGGAYSAYQSSGSLSAGFASLFGGGTATALSGYGTTAATGYGASSVIAGGNLGVGAGSGAAAGGASSGLAAIPVAGWIAMGMMASSDAYDQGFRANTNFEDPLKALTDVNTSLNIIDGTLQSIGVDGKTAAILSGSALGAQLSKLLGVGGEYVQSLGESVATIVGNTIGISGSGGTNDVSIGGGLNIRQTDVSDKFTSGLASAFVKAAQSLGVSTSGATFGFGSNNSDGGKFGLTASVGGQTYKTGDIKTSEAALQLEASRAVFFALQGSELPGYLSKVFDGITASTAAQADIDAALAYAGSLKQIRDALTETRTPLEILQDSVASAFTALGSSADTFKTDFVAAIDQGITPDKLAEYLALGQNLDALAQASGTASEAVKDVGRSLADITSERKSLDERYAQATLNEQQLIDRTRESIDASNQVRYDEVIAAEAAKTAAEKLADAQTEAAEKAKQAAEQLKAINDGLKDRLDVLTGAQTDRSLQLRDATDKSTQALLRQIFAQEDAKTAAQELADAQTKSAQQAAAAVEAMAQRVSSAIGGLSNTRFDLENKLLTLQGNTGEVATRTRSNDLSKLTDGITSQSEIDRITASYDYNLSLTAQIDALTASKAAAEENARAQAQAQDAANRATESAANAANKLRDAWQGVTDSLFDEVRRIRGLTGAGSAQSFAQAQSNFSIAAAQAKAGDQDAAKLLPELSKVLLSLAETQATSLLQLRVIQGQTAGALEAVGGSLASQYGLTLPKLATGTNYIPKDGPYYLHEGESVVPVAYNPSSGGQNNDALIAEMQAMRVMLAALQAAADKTATATTNSDKTLTRVTRGGDNMITKDYTVQ